MPLILCLCVALIDLVTEKSVLIIIVDLIYSINLMVYVLIVYFTMQKGVILNIKPFKGTYLLWTCCRLTLLLWSYIIMTLKNKG